MIKEIVALQGREIGSFEIQFRGPTSPSSTCGLKNLPRVGDNRTQFSHLETCVCHCKLLLPIKSLLQAGYASQTQWKPVFVITNGVSLNQIHSSNKSHRQTLKKKIEI